MMSLAGGLVIYLALLFLPLSSASGHTCEEECWLACKTYTVVQVIRAGVRTELEGQVCIHSGRIVSASSSVLIFPP